MPALRKFLTVQNLSIVACCARMAASGVAQAKNIHLEN